MEVDSPRASTAGRSPAEQARGNKELSQGARNSPAHASSRRRRHLCGATSVTLAAQGRSVAAKASILCPSPRLLAALEPVRIPHDHVSCIANHHAFCTRRVPRQIHNRLDLPDPVQWRCDQLFLSFCLVKLENVQGCQCATKPVPTSRPTHRSSTAARRNCLPLLVFTGRSTEFSAAP